MVSKRISLISFIILTMAFVSSCTPTSDVNPPAPAIATISVGKTEAPKETGTAEAEPLVPEPEEKLPTPTQLPTPTSIPPTEIPPTVATAPLPTLSSGPINLPDLDMNRPDDVLPQIVYFVGGGGRPTDCSDVYYNNTDNWMQYPPHVAHVSPEGNVDWLMDIYIVTCGWEPGERIFVDLIGDGEFPEFTGTPHADEWGSVAVDLHFTREYLPGSYRFKFNGASATLWHTVELNPEGPTVYQVFGSSEETTDELQLVGFQPGEIVRLT